MSKVCYTYDAVARIEEERSHLLAGQRHGKRGSYDVYEHPKHEKEKLLTRFLGSRVWETFEEAKNAMEDGGEEGTARHRRLRRPEGAHKERPAAGAADVGRIGAIKLGRHDCHGRDDSGTP